ncbi:MAG: hypothetical protein IKQ92_03130 [Clostridia bacterium]|nr:hypothetical protein [Clostridia bacterium]
MKTVYGFPLPDDPRGKETEVSKIFYVKDSKNGSFPSVDGDIRYMALKGKALFEYLNSKEGKNKVFYKDNEYGTDRIGVEVPAKLAKKVKAEKNREDYLEQVKEDSGIIEVSLDQTIENSDGDETNLYDIIKDEYVDVEGEVIHRMMLLTLRKARRFLTDDENRLLDCLYNDTNPLSEKKTGEVLGMTQQAVNYQKKKIFKKIRKYFEKGVC